MSDIPQFEGMTDEDEAVLRGAIVRMNASDVEQFNEYERRIADLESQLAEAVQALSRKQETFERLRNMLQQRAYRLEPENKLLRAVAEAADSVSEIYHSRNVTIEAVHIAILKLDKELQAAIDGGALEVE